MRLGTTPLGVRKPCLGSSGASFVQVGVIRPREVEQLLGLKRKKIKIHHSHGGKNATDRLVELSNAGEEAWGWGVRQRV